VPNTGRLKMSRVTINPAVQRPVARCVNTGHVTNTDTREAPPAMEQHPDDRNPHDRAKSLTSTQATSPGAIAPRAVKHIENPVMRASAEANLRTRACPQTCASAESRSFPHMMRQLESSACDCRGVGPQRRWWAGPLT
jgi:hypothetical protein